MRRVCVFAGSNFGREMAYRKAAEQLGRVLTDRGIGMVYGGARVGLMGTVADAVLGAGGEVIGVIPEALVAREVAHNGLSTLRVVASMHERKALMASLSDLLSFVDHSIRQGFVRDACRPMVLVATSPADLLDQLGRYEASTRGARSEIPAHPAAGTP